MKPEAFPDDHPIEIIRGLRRPDRAGVLRSFAQRAAWLSNRMELDARTSVRGIDNSCFTKEIKAIAVAVEAIDRVAQLERELAELRGSSAAPVANDEVGEGFAERFETAQATSFDKVARIIAAKDGSR